MIELVFCHCQFRPCLSVIVETPENTLCFDPEFENNLYLVETHDSYSP